MGKGDWVCLSWIANKVPRVKKRSILTELEDYLVAPSKDVSKLKARGVAQYCNKLVTCTYRSNSVFQTLRFSCATPTISNLVHSIAEVSVLDEINGTIPLMNDIILCFGILSSVK